MSATYELSSPAMGTVVCIQLVGDAGSDPAPRAREAMRWFPLVEAACSRFREDSELRQLCRQEGEPVRVSPLLFQVIDFALAVAQSSDGAFDPTVGAQLEARRFTRAWHSGEEVRSGIAANTTVSWRDVVLNESDQTVLLRKPMLLDLGAVAKGMAVDLAAQELRDLEHFAVNAGGDMYLAGCNGNGHAWSVGIRHPVHHDQPLQTVHVRDRAVCTSGNYQKRAEMQAKSHAETHMEMRTETQADHIVQPAAYAHHNTVASVTVIAPTAMVADALATATFVLGAERGLEFLHAQGVDGLIVTRDLQLFATHGMSAYSATNHKTHEHQHVG